MREGLLGGHVGHEAMHPGHKGVPGVHALEIGDRAAEDLDLADVDGLEQGLAVGEVAIQRPDPDFGAAGDLLQ